MVNIGPILLLHDIYFITNFKFTNSISEDAFGMWNFKEKIPDFSHKSFCKNLAHKLIIDNI